MVIDEVCWRKAKGVIGFLACCLVILAGAFSFNSLSTEVPLVRLTWV